MLAASGLALSLFLSLLALNRSRRATGSYYEYEVYGMTRAAHRRYAAVSAAFALFFLAALFVRGLPVTPVAGGYVIFMVFYLASFARGFGE